jgi:hypothetical protein
MMKELSIKLQNADTLAGEPVNTFTKEELSYVLSLGETVNDVFVPDYYVVDGKLFETGTN